MHFERTTLQTFARLVVCAAAIALSAALPAKAAGLENRVPVYYGDLKISAPPGAKILIARLKRAAKEACGGEPDSIDPGRRSMFASCVRDAVGRAVDTVGEPMVSRLYLHPENMLLADQ